MANNILKMSNAGGTSSVTRYIDMLAGNTAYNPAAYDSIATVTVGAGGSSSISFTSIPSTYTHLQIRGIARDNGGSSQDELTVRFNSDSGNNYSWHYLQGYVGATVASSGSTTSRIIVRQLTTAVQTANSFGTFVIDVLDYANSNKYKTLRALGGYNDNGQGTVNLNSGLWQSTSAISSITITNERATNFLQYTTFALYGVKA